MMGVLCPWITFIFSTLFVSCLALSSNGRQLSLEVGPDCLAQKDLWCVAQHQQPSTAATLQPSLLGIFSRPSAGGFQMPAPVICAEIVPLLQHYLTSLYFFLLHISCRRQPSFEVSGTRDAIKKCCIFIRCLCWHKTTVWGTLRAKKKRVKKVSSLYLSREEKHEEINTVLSCCPRVISEARRWDCEALISPECVLAQREACCCATKVWGQISMYVWNASKMSLTLILKCGLKGRERGGGGGGGELGLQLASVGL